MIANIYIDGFNFYYGRLRGTPYRWFDLAKFCALVLPGHRINRIRYFTALAELSSEFPQRRQRQQTYFRALATIPNLSLHYGFFLRRNVTMRLAYPEAAGPETVTVTRSEEKGTDVNLACYMLLDAFDNDYELAVVISNDSDLVTPIRIARERFGLTVGVLNPHPSRSRTLAAAADFYRPIRRGPLSAAQFPDRMRDAAGAFAKPTGW